MGIKRGGLSDEDLGEVGEDTPVAMFVSIGQRAAGGGLAETGVIEFWTEGDASPGALHFLIFFSSVLSVPLW